MGNKTYTAVYTINSYTVTMNANGGTNVDNITKKYNTEIGSLPIPTKEGHNLIGWFINDVKIDETYKIVEDKTTIAKWEKKKYTVTFDINGGNEIDSKEVEYEDIIDEPTEPTRNEYKFVKWLDENNNKFDFSTKITRNITLKAEWKKLHTVTFNPVRGTTSEETRIVEDGNEIGTLPIPNKKGHNFKGWWTKEEDGTRIYQTQKITGDTTIYAHWEPKQYIVTLGANADGGNKINYGRFTGSQYTGRWDMELTGKTILYMMYRFNEVQDKYILIPNEVFYDGEGSEYTSASEYKEPFHCMGTFVKWVDNNGNEYEDDATFHTFGQDRYLKAVWNIDQNQVATPGNLATSIKNLYATGKTINLIDDDPDNNVRYYGACVNNRVRFNDEIWYIVGVFNVDDGSGNIEPRVKLVYPTELYQYRYKYSDANVNGGKGINQWGPSTYQDGTPYEGSDLMLKLNGDYLDTTKPKALKSDAQNLIDNAKWHTGAIELPNGTTKKFTPAYIYQEERGNKTGGHCTGYPYCDDTVIRTTSWVGKVGLVYPSDYLYASSGNEEGREACLNNNVRLTGVASRFYNIPNYCTTDRSWMPQTSNIPWALNPYYSSAYLTFNLSSNLGVDSANSGFSNWARPSVYLKTNVKLTGGEGLMNNPYTIELE